MLRRYIALPALLLFLGLPRTEAQGVEAVVELDSYETGISSGVAACIDALIEIGSTHWNAGTRLPLHSRLKSVLILRFPDVRYFAIAFRREEPEMRLPDGTQFDYPPDLYGELCHMSNGPGEVLFAQSVSSSGDLIDEEFSEYQREELELTESELEDWSARVRTDEYDLIALLTSAEEPR